MVISIGYLIYVNYRGVLCYFKFVFSLWFWNFKMVGKVCLKKIYGVLGYFLGF